MPSYDLLDTYVATGDGISVTPHWVIAVVRFKNQVTFDRTSNAIGNRSFRDTDEYAVDEDEILVVTDCAQLNVASSKGAHVTSAQAVLLPSRNYEESINAGDWMFAWMLNSEDMARDLVDRIHRREPCNGFKDGFKFMGRVQSVTEDMTVGPEGNHQVMYSLTAAGFTEFDSAVVYFPQIALDDAAALPKWWINFGLELQNLVYADYSADASYDAGTLNINKVLPTFLRVLLGEGLPQSGTNPGGEQDPRLQTSPNTSAYLVPRSAAALLGRKASRSTPSYADLLEGIVGVQRYHGSQTPESIFFPEVKNRGPMYETPEGLVGEFVPNPPPLDLVPVWNVLGMFLNSAINEMYVTLRLNEHGAVVPYFIARQIPFTTRVGAANRQGLPRVTEYTNLPRWKIPPQILKGYRLGKSDVTRFNLVQAQGVTSGVPQDAAYSWVNNPPVRDDADAKRSGVRAFQRMVNCSYNESRSKDGAKAWTNTLSDFVVGMHLTRNGTINLFGVHAPIPVGDNIEFLGHIYHIEAVTHSCSIDPEGARHFETTLSVSHGMSGDEAVQQRVQKGESTVDAQYIKGSGNAPDFVTASET